MSKKPSDTFRVLSLTLLVSFLTCHLALGSHIRAGEITAQRIDNITLTYEFTFTGYRDTETGIEFGDGTFDLGDGTIFDGRFEITETPEGENLVKSVFKIRHTYQAASAYVVSYQESFRNEGIANMDFSDNTDFYVESLIIIDPFLGLNNTPILTVPPIDFGAVGVGFIHNAGAYDPDGDSLSYSFTTPKRNLNNPVSNYRTLNDPEFYTNFSQGNEFQNNTPSLTIDPISGDLVWDAPGDVLDGSGIAEYNVAFVVTEWRNFAGNAIELGYVTRDMQIIIEQSDNQRPTLIAPENLCVEAGQTAEATVEGSDPDGDPVKLEAFGGPFEVQGTKATYSPNPAVFQQPVAFLNFEWNTSCGQVRLRPYEVQFKVTDNPSSGPRLVDFQTMEVTVVGPAPHGLITSPQAGGSVFLEWDAYECSNATSMEIWRRVGDFAIELDECEIGMPPNTGYSLIDEVALNQPGGNQLISYLDDNNGAGLAAGAKYCYRLVATYPLPGGGESYVSSEVCELVEVDVPAITNVDVLVTDGVNGAIEVRWVPPYEIDSALYPPPFTYDLYRSEGFASAASNYSLISPRIADTVFQDTGLNTLENPYHYLVSIYSEDILVDSSASASSVRLSLTPLLKSIELRWEAEVPWSNTLENFPYHYVYRDQITNGQLDQLVLVDSVDVTQSGYYYLDDGFDGEMLDEEIEYCYYVSVSGSYDNPLLPEPLINRTQISCAQPNDTIPPCSPPAISMVNQLDCEAILVGQDCGDIFFDQEISWAVDNNPDCDLDIVSYNIYFSSTGLEEDYEFLDTELSTTYTHADITSIKGCYRVTSVDRSGNESNFSDEICNDNCPVYNLPNVFTPNGDGFNDVFTPLYRTENNLNTLENQECPRFIQSVEFIVFDRSGNEVFAYQSNDNSSGIYINWDGTNKSGRKLPSGVYYYQADLVRDLINPEERPVTLNGWVQIIR